MGQYVLRRCLQAVPLLLVLTVVAFGLLELAPGDPAVKAAAADTGRIPDPAVVEQYRRDLRLDDPMAVRYLHWLGAAVRGNLGNSYSYRRPVSEVVADTLPPTILLVGLGMLLAWLLALIVGVSAGLRPASALSRGVGATLAVLVGTPTFVVALLALWLFTVEWRVFPTGGMTDAGAAVSPPQLARHVALPAAVIGVSYFGWYARVVEASVATVRSMPYVSVARAKGLPERLVTMRHIVRPALVPFVTQAGTSMGVLIGGAYAVEVVYSWPGLGRTALRAAQLEDYPLVIALVLVTGAVVIAGNLAADLLAAALDPRSSLRNQGEGA